MPETGSSSTHAGGQHAVDDQRQNDKHRADPLRALGQLGVQTLGLGLAHIAIRDAADRAGQTLALAGLKQHHQNEDEAGQQL